MNELIKVDYSTDRPTVSARELHEFLICCPYTRYSHEAITYLLDCIICEKVLPCNSKSPRNSTEKYYQKIIVESFESIFPDFLYVGNEVPIPPVGRIDILAKDKKTTRDVIIELKVDDKNPAQQLLAYATAYKNPILIGISTRKFSPKTRNNQVQYYTYEELGL